MFLEFWISIWFTPRDLNANNYNTAGRITIAGAWLALLLETGLHCVDGSAFAATQLARLTGDRTRDLDDDLRARALTALRTADAPERWLRMLTEVVALEAADEAQALGDTLPMGLKLR